MLNTELNKRALPPLKSREEMVEILQKCVYGYLPQVEYTISAAEPTKVETRYMCGTVAHTYTALTVATGRGSHTFRVDRLLHTDGKKRPLIVYMNFHPMGTSAYSRSRSFRNTRWIFSPSATRT